MSNMLDIEVHECIELEDEHEVIYAIYLGDGYFSLEVDHEEDDDPDDYEIGLITKEKLADAISKGEYKER
jgi:hypothetical protein